MQKPRLGEILVMAGLLDEPELRQALFEQRKRGRCMLGTLLVELGLLSESTMTLALSRQFDLPMANIETLNVAPDAVRVLTAEEAWHLRALPFELIGKRLSVLTSDPTHQPVFDALEGRLLLKIALHVGAWSEVERLLFEHYGPAPSE